MIELVEPAVRIDPVLTPILAVARTIDELVEDDRDAGRSGVSREQHLAEPGLGLLEQRVEADQREIGLKRSHLASRHLESLKQRFAIPGGGRRIVDTQHKPRRSF